MGTSRRRCLDGPSGKRILYCCAALHRRGTRKGSSAVAENEKGGRDKPDRPSPSIELQRRLVSCTLMRGRRNSGPGHRTVVGSKLLMSQVMQPGVRCRTDCSRPPRSRDGRRKLRGPAQLQIGVELRVPSSWPPTSSSLPDVARRSRWRRSPSPSQSMTADRLILREGLRTGCPLRALAADQLGSRRRPGRSRHNCAGRCCSR